MAGSFNRLEVLPGSETRFAPDPRPKRSHRPFLFLLTLAVCLAASLYYVFQRPAVYRAGASLLTVTSPEIDQQREEADTQHVAIQRQLLLGKPLLDQVLWTLKKSEQSDDYATLSIQQLRSMLSVVPVPDTNLVELRAEGSNAAELAGIVNTWVKVYQESRAAEISQALGKTTESLRQQYQALEDKITLKRREQDAFRESNDILSMGRDENQVLARLKGLTKSLNDASEEEVKAKARLDAITAAIERGEAVVPNEDKRSLAQMERRAQELREKLAELDRNYTREFLALSPTLKVIPEQLAELEAKIESAKAQGRDLVAGAARRDFAAARQAVSDLRQQLDDHKQQARDFTARFAEHEALKEDLARMEELYRGIESRLVQIEVQNRAKYPQVRVVEWAFQPYEPVRPLYLRDAGIAIAGSALAALFMVWLVEFLGAQKQLVSPITLQGVTINPPNSSATIGRQSSVAGLASTAAPALESPFPRELSESEVAALLDGADSITRTLIALLLSGVDVNEVVRIEQEDFCAATGCLEIHGRSARSLRLPAATARYLGEIPGFSTSWLMADSGASDTEELEMRLKLAAVDGGLPDAEQVNASVLRHTYLVYLVKQGIRLSDMESLAGKMPSKHLFNYGQFSPAGPGKPITEIAVDYPLLHR